MTTGPSAEVAVIGAGAMGAWTALCARRAGAVTTLIDAFGAGDSRATSGDESRIIRSSHGEDAFYAAWARRAKAAWLTLAEEAGETLFLPTGVLWLGHHEDGFETASVHTLTSLGIPVERLSRADVAARWPQLASGDLAFAVLEPEAGALLARRGVATVARRFVESGGRAELGMARPGTITAGRLADVVLGDGRRIAAERFVFAAGPWLPRLFPDLLGDLIRVTKQDVVFIGAPAGDRRFDPERMPVWVDYDAAFYGFPNIEGRGLKLGPDRYGPIFDPTNGERIVDPESVRLVRRYLARRVPDLADSPVVETRVCQYETTPDTHFIIDRHPGLENVWIVGGGSGHGFKHGPVIGERVAAALLGGDVEADDGRFALGHERIARPGMRTGADEMTKGWVDW
jgi:sarcosine oxidase